jgi:hypothetical protein
MTRYETKIGNRLVIDNKLDSEKELELTILDSDGAWVYLSKKEVIALRDHLNKVLENEANATNN